jgi:thioredoxin 1
MVTKKTRTKTKKADKTTLDTAPNDLHETPHLSRPTFLARWADMIFSIALILAILAGLIAALTHVTVTHGAEPNGVVLLEFGATWCAPCQAMTPIVAEMARQGYAIRHVNVDHEPWLARQYSITSVPAFVLVDGNRVVDSRIGIQSEVTLQTMFRRYPRRLPLPPPVIRLELSHGRKS